MTEDDRPHSRACGWRNHDHGSACHSNCPTCQGRAGPHPTNKRLRMCPQCGDMTEADRFRKAQDCPRCDGTGFVPVEMTGAAGLTWQEQQEVLVLLRYWWEFHRGGLPMDEAVLLFTKALLDKHSAGGR